MDCLQAGKWESVCPALIKTPSPASNKTPESSHHARYLTNQPADHYLVINITLSPYDHISKQQSDRWLLIFYRTPISVSAARTAWLASVELRFSQLYTNWVWHSKENDSLDQWALFCRITLLQLQQQKWLRIKEISWNISTTVCHMTIALKPSLNTEFNLKRLIILGVSVNSALN